MTLKTSKLDRPSIGLALSGGAARGMAHIGVLRALEENAIPVDAIAGAAYTRPGFRSHSSN
jgi:NTE family protein